MERNGGRFLLVENIYIKVQISNINIAHAGRHWAPVLESHLSPRDILGERCSREMEAVGTRPRVPGSPPLKPECGFAARCPGRLAIVQLT